MAEINEIIAKQAIEGTLTAAKAIDSLDQATLKLIGDIDKLTTKLNEVSGSNKSASEKAEEYSKIINKSVDDNKKLSDSNNELIKQQKALETVEAKIKVAKSDTNKELIKQKQNLSEVNKQTKDEIVLNNKSAGTREKLAASNRLLRQEREKLNLETEEGQKRLIEVILRN